MSISPKRQLATSQQQHMAAAAAVDGDFIRIDGSKGEGGGQILRNAMSFATILGKRLIVSNIRAGRSKQGLASQHVTGLDLAARIVHAHGCSHGVVDGQQQQHLVGATVGSTEIRYEPGDEKRGSLDGGGDGNNNMTSTDEEQRRSIEGDIRTAGSICLLLQVALPCALFQKLPCTLVLKGGTNASMAPQYDYWERVFWPTLVHRCGWPSNQVQADVISRGYFPRGGGEVHVHVSPLTRKQQPLPAIRLTERGDVHRIYIRSFHAGNLPRILAEKMAQEARKTLAKVTHDIKGQKSPLRIETDIVTETQAVGSGFGILVVAETTTGCLLAGSALSSPKDRTSAEQVGQEAASELISTLRDGGCVDEWLQDQLILFMALAEGVSEIHTGSFTLHTQTAIWIAEVMSGARFEVSRLVDDDNDEMGSKSIQQPSLLKKTSHGYGQNERIPGRHSIKCHGIGFRVDNNKE